MFVAVVKCDRSRDGVGDACECGAGGGGNWHEDESDGSDGSWPVSNDDDREGVSITIDAARKT